MNHLFIILVKNLPLKSRLNGARHYTVFLSESKKKKVQKVAGVNNSCSLTKALEELRD